MMIIGDKFIWIKEYFLKSTKEVPKYFLDRNLVIYTILLSFIGILFIYSANISHGQEISFKKNSFRQIFYFLSGLFLMFSFSFINYKKIAEHSNWIYLICILLLLFTFFFW